MERDIDFLPPPLLFFHVSKTMSWTFIKGVTIRGALVLEVMFKFKLDVKIWNS